MTPAGVHTTTVYVRDLPVELSDESVKSVYGDVYSVQHACFKEFPELRNGNRLLLMSVSTPIPSSLNVLGFVCRTWYSGQPVHCTVCKESGHLPRACAGAACSPVTWPVIVRSLGALPVPVHLCLFRLLLMLLFPCPLTLKFAPLCLLRPPSLLRPSLPFHLLCPPSPLQFRLFFP